MRIHLLYFEGCPNWHVMHERLLEAVALVDDDCDVQLVEVQSPEMADRWGFHGSPSVLVDGTDLFAAPGSPVGLTCRLYPTPDGVRGTPTLEQVVAALGR
ncbi:alkylmercury lyase [Actinotalea ferrariae CF5-4]|uniref:Alkylmercury lyase n=1 Tax=Actinotalea ferrariae CF5-4 TaxID=948458 RepID=A0A021VLW1_9CELL|nr:hypothetical protein [Actinotalea ferrariae]EYR62073.1 alkylmercury lyase [Actinotalea ferrariae CF5-4]